MADIGEPLKRYKVVPLRETVPATPEPSRRESVPEREPTPAAPAEPEKVPA